MPTRTYAAAVLLALLALLCSRSQADDISPLDRADERSLQLRDDPTRFNIDLSFDTPITAAQRAGFESAKNKWMSIITKDSAVVTCFAAGYKSCGHRFNVRTCIDDLFIIVRVKPMDGIGNVLGAAGPCVTNLGKTRIGVMVFDSADANDLIRAGAWTSTVLHEMGHILGLGTLWEERGRPLITSPRSGPPYYYTGVNGNNGLRKITGRSTGQIAIEDQGGEGTARGHWKESTYRTELMTGWVEEGRGARNPISAMTVYALMDLGFQVDLKKIEPYSLPTRGRRLREGHQRQGKRFSLANDILKMDIVELSDEDAPEVEQIAKEGQEEKLQEERRGFKARRSRLYQHPVKEGDA